ncbi:MAG: HAD family phosphatase [Paludibacteraceae bacterium]|nr:HAD family phosphatase [Paludibacteraceae bacterium]
MKQYNNISTLIFDFGGVIINLDLPACIQKINTLGIPDVVKYLSNYGQAGFFLKFEKGEISTNEFRNEIRKLSTKTLTDTQIDDAWCEFLQDIPQHKLDVIEKLKSEYRVILLSNTNPLHIEQSATREFAKRGKKIDDYFDECYLSYKMKMTKPDREIFDTLLKKENVKPEDCLFLDDGPKNINSAKALGINSILINPAEKLDFLLELLNKNN